MHRQFKTYLPNAVGVSEFVIAVNIDIRGFSNFSRKVESPEVAIFVKKVYSRLLDDYFSNATFFKPTGDGLLLLISYSEDSLTLAVQTVIANCFKVLTDFGSFTVNDPMVNFDVPRQVGIGLSRGTACRLISGRKTLDYSGRVLNLASRLMDFARPSGIVFDSDFGIELLLEEQAQQFQADKVYIRGIAEREPVDIFLSKDFTIISALNKQPLDQTKWRKIQYSTTLRKIKASNRFALKLPVKPLDSAQIKLRVKHPSIYRGRRQKGLETFFDFPNFEFAIDADEPRVIIHFDALAKRLTEAGVKNNWNIKFDLNYPE